MLKRFGALALIFALLSVPGSAATLGPAASYQELADLLAVAQPGDTLLIEGAIAGDGSALSTSVPVRIQTASGRASISRLHLTDASVTLSGVDLTDSVIIEGKSSVQLTGGTTVTGSAGQSGLSFAGCGTLIVDRGCEIRGGDESDGVTVSHRGGECYISIDGTISGGSGATGGNGMTVSPLGSSAAVMISGTISGGDGHLHGGHALNLYELSGNAYVTVAGRIQGGSGSVGGDGIQLVSASDNATVGINGRVKGGSGDAYGGDALILMNAGGASSVSLSGVLSGGDALSENAHPGTSLQMVGKSASHARVLDCILEDGNKNAPPAQATPAPPAVTPLPEITAPIEEAETSVPSDPSELLPEFIATPSEATPSEPALQPAP